MTSYEAALDRAEKMGLTVIDGYEFESGLKGLIAGRLVVISKSAVTDREKAAVLLEEMAHFRANAGDITDFGVLSNHKQERRAHKLMVHERLPLQSIAEAALRLGIDTNLSEIAEALDVAEPLLREAIALYAAEYGPVVETEGLVIRLEPFFVKRKENTAGEIRGDKREIYID